MSCKRILVTGGSRGIGRSVVETLTKSGYDVDFVYSRDSEEIEKICQFGSDKNQVTAYQCDLAQEQEVESLCQEFENKGAYWGFVHCAGITNDSLSATLELEASKRLMQINFWSFVEIAKTLLRPMMRNKSGRILAVSSVAALQGSKGNGIYSASKSALNAYIRVIASEFSRKGVLANCIAPGFVNTDMLSPYASNFDEIASCIPVNRIGQVNDISSVVNFLMSEEACYINAQCITIDGGMTHCR